MVKAWGRGHCVGAWSLHEGVVKVVRFLQGLVLNGSTVHVNRVCINLRVGGRTDRVYVFMWTSGAQTHC